MNRTIKNTIIIAALIAAAVAWRIINHNYSIAPNLEIITTVSVLAALIIGFRGAIIVPLGSMIISDMFIGNTSIFIFTWSSFAVIGLLALLLKKLDEKPKKQILGALGFAITSSFLFFFITNFGVWLQGWYPANFAGLIRCFTMAIPFYRTMLIGNIIIIPSVVAIRQSVKAYRLSRLNIRVKSTNV
jgi:hypothetical protein